MGFSLNETWKDGSWSGLKNNSAALKETNKETNRMCVSFVAAQRGFHSYILLCECTHYDPRHTHTLYLNILSLALKQQTKEGSRSSCSLANGSCMLMPASESANAAKLMAGRHSFSSSCVSGSTSRKNHHEGR